MNELAAPVDEQELAVHTAGEEDARPRRPRAIRSYQIDALLRRREAMSDTARVVLDARVTQLQQALVKQGAAPRAGDVASLPSLVALSELVQRLRGHQPSELAVADSTPQSQQTAAPTLLQETRAVWQKVRTQSHLRRARGKPLEHAGPLNSTKLVGRTLEVMGEISHAYQQHFVAYLDVLAELDTLIGEAPSEPVASAKRASKPRAPRKRKVDQAAN